MSVTRTRRAQLDEDVKERIRQRVRELMDEKSSGGENPEDGSSDEVPEGSGEKDVAEGNESGSEKQDAPAGSMSGGELMSLLFGDDEVEESEEVTARNRKADVFPTEKALKNYLREHPDADRSKHKVERKFHTPAEKEPESKGRSEGEKKEPGTGGKHKDEKKPEKGPGKVQEPSGENKEPEDGDEVPKGEKGPQEAPDGEKEAPDGKGPAKEPYKPVEKPAKGYFSEDEMALPELVVQKGVKSKEELFKGAKEAQEQMMDWLDRGKGIDKKLGLKHFDLAKDKDSPVDLDSKGPVLITAPLKGEKRSQEKVDKEYKGKWEHLADVVRASIALDTESEIGGVLKTLRESGMKLARRPKDRFEKPTTVGYRDILLNVEYPNGHVGELQLHVKPMIKAKEKAHKLYEVVRPFEEAAQADNRTTMTDEERKMVDHANNLMKSIYAEAWSRSRKASERLAAGGNRYYDYDGNPARWRYKEFPTVWREGRQHVVYDIFKFVHESRDVEKGEFDEMLKKQGSSRTSSLATEVAAGIIGDRVAARGMQLVRKDKDAIRDTGGRSKGRSRDPEMKPPREEARKPWRTKAKPAPDREKDVDRNPDRNPDRDMRTAASFASLARRELSAWPRRFAEMVVRM